MVAVRCTFLLFALFCWVGVEGECPRFFVSPTSWSFAANGTGDLNLVLNQDATATICVPNGASATPSSVAAGGGKVVLAAGSFLGLAQISITVTEGPCVNTTVVPWFVDRTDAGVSSVQSCATPGRNFSIGHQGSSIATQMSFTTYSASCMNGAQNRTSNGRCLAPIPMAPTIPEPSSANLAAWWKFDEPGFLVDSSGNGRTLTAYSTPPVSASGKSGTAVTFSSGQHYRITNGPTPVNGAFTVALWVHMSSIPTWPTIYRRWIGSSSTNFDIIFGLYSNTGRLDLSFFTNSGQVTLQGTTPVPTNAWCHIGFVADGVSQLCTWLGGVKRDCATYDGTIRGNTQDRVDIGGLDGIYPFVGKFDDFRVYTRGLTDAEMLMLSAN